MPVDYRKWDNLELSDDSDIEVHPNVDKRSFIRAKQNQIHQERHQRKQRIAALKYEVGLHEALLERITALVASLKSKPQVSDTKTSGQLAFEAVMEMAAKHKDDALPTVPEGLIVDPNQPKTYSAMMAGLLDQVNKTVEEKKTKPEDRFAAMVAEIEVHEGQVRTLIRDSGKELAELEKEEGKKITSESIHTGFNSSQVNKTSGSGGGDSTKVELLNPNFERSSEDAASKTENNDNNDDELEASPAAKKFADISASDYAASLQYITSNPQIVVERETDGLLVMAFDAALEDKQERCRQYVHQALLLQYCRSLGRDGIGLFFRRVAPTSGGRSSGGNDKNNNAKDMFLKDVQDTYMRIRNRAREIIVERAKDAAEGKDGVEQIQLQAVEPGTVITIRVPPADSDDAEEQEAREIYEQFSEEMKTALETGQLDKVNKVLGDLSVPDAEEYVHLFGEAGILSVEDQILDATTEEGQQQIKDMQAKMAAERAAEEEPVGDPE